MKKLILTIAAVSAAVVASASTVKWTASNVLDHTGGALNDSTYKNAYAATVYFFNSDGTVFASCASSADTSYSMKQFTATTSDSFTVGTTYLAQLVITGTEGTTEYTYTTGKEEFTVGAAAPSLNFSTGTDFDSFTGTSYAAASWTGGSSVPEPTSGLLLLLGVAGLALKRRRA